MRSRSSSVQSEHLSTSHQYQKQFYQHEENFIRLPYYILLVGLFLSLYFLATSLIMDDNLFAKHQSIKDSIQQIFNIFAVGTILLAMIIDVIQFFMINEYQKLCTKCIFCLIIISFVLAITSATLANINSHFYGTKQIPHPSTCLLAGSAITFLTFLIAIIPCIVQQQ
ncbi:hypothetical protein MN116_000920 [Schistosoma mekongi]|uniref:Uncharacterized protein n=1 Tax=Schistosoma mekongi TaxID=38744 RepID=A0AAE1ZKP0_SCHME|nr:hypothetical protein MN116_000920 [Schistosoma mekongi]